MCRIGRVNAEEKKHLREKTKEKEAHNDWMIILLT
jgi:hypothetical protein